MHSRSISIGVLYTEAERADSTNTSRPEIKRFLALLSAFNMVPQILSPWPVSWQH
jgi:hypothetical protein